MLLCEQYSWWIANFKAAKESSYICNQATGFNRYLTKVQDAVQSQLKIIQGDQKIGKSSLKCQNATDELVSHGLNQSISQATAKTIEHLSDVVFLSNITMTRRDPYLDHFIQQVTLGALRTVLLLLATLFQDGLLKKAEDDITLAASEAFQLGVSLEQLLSACHWKSHITFTQFYLKDVAWADSALSPVSSGDCLADPPQAHTN